MTNAITAALTYLVILTWGCITALGMHTGQRPTTREWALQLALAVSALILGSVVTRMLTR